MPVHEFDCRECDEHRQVVTSAGMTPRVPDHCGSKMRKNFRSVQFGQVEVDVMSPATGYHSSTRKYEDSLKALSDKHTERTGFESNYVRSDPSESAPPPVET